MKQLHSETNVETADLLVDLSRVFRGLMRLTQADAPAMTPTQRIALFEVGEAGPLRLSDLAARMGVSPPTASRAVDTLHELGFVERVEDPDDRRALQIDLTARGKRFLAERKAKAREAFGPAAATLSASERKTLSRLLRKTADGLRAA